MRTTLEYADSVCAEFSAGAVKWADYNYNNANQADFHANYDWRSNPRAMKKALAASVATLQMFRGNVAPDAFRRYLQNDVYAIEPGSEGKLTDEALGSQSAE